MSRPYLTTRLLASYGHRKFLLLPTKPTACVAARAVATQQSLGNLSVLLEPAKDETCVQCLSRQVQ